jgi:serine protease Do
MNSWTLNLWRWTAALAAVILLPLQDLRGADVVAVTNLPPTLADMVAIQDKVLAMLERTVPCTVKVDGGSGVIIDEAGTLLSVAHVCRVADRPVTITFPDGKVVKGKTLGNNAKVDAGMARISDPYEGPHVPMGDSDAVKPGDWCVALGYPVSYKLGQAPAVRLGRVLNIQSHAIITDCTIMGGDSGGPLFNLDGEVIGIGSRASGSTRQNISVPVNEFTEAWDRHLAGTDWSGCRHDKTEDHGQAYLGISPVRKSRGTEIGKVYPDSPAEKAGLRAGDVVTTIDGVRVAFYREILPVIFRKKPGDKLDICIQRDATALTLNVALGEVSQ